jgi:hypothetical protein
MSTVHPAVAQNPFQSIVQRLPQSPGQTGPSAPPSGMRNILKNAAIFGGIGAVAGLGASLIGLPVIGALSAPITAAIGGAIGVAVGVVRGIIQNRRAIDQPPVPGQLPPLPSTPPPPPTGTQLG